MDQFEHQLVPTNNIKLSLYTAGPRDGRPVWLLHGFPECWYSWRHQAKVLANQGYRVHIPEMRGYGASSAPEAVEAYDLITLCADIPHTAFTRAGSSKARCQAMGAPQS